MNPAADSTRPWDARRVRIMVQRRRWWLLTPLLALGLGGALLPHWLPAQYRSQAMILVQQQQVPAQYVAPNVIASAADNLQIITQQVLSRTRLQRLIETLGLYPRERQRATMDSLVTRMGRKIVATTVTAPDRPDQLVGFRIAYTASTPVLAQRVVSDLTSLFIEDNLQARAQTSASTTSFLQTQLQQARRQLADREAGLNDFKARHLGELPEQEQGNLAILQSLNMQYNADIDDVQRAQQDRAYFQSLQEQYEQRQADGQVAAPLDPNSPQARLQALQLKLAGLLATHTAAYPDVRSTRDEIGRLQQQVAAAAPRAGAGAAPDDAAPGGPVGIEAASRLKALDLEIAARQQDAAATQKRIQAVQAGLNLTPLNEQALSSLTQGVDDAQKNYQSLLQKDQASQLATNLEEDQQGERFEVIDPASLPQQPVSPNPALFFAAGWLLGLAVGAGLMVLREIGDCTVTGEAALAALVAAPQLAAIPELTLSGAWRRWSRRALEAALVLALVAVATAAALWGRI